MQTAGTTLAVPWFEKGDGSPSPFLLATKMNDQTITTARLTLRPFQPADAPRVRMLADNAEIAQMVASCPHPYPEGLAEKWIALHPARRAAGTGFPFAIESDGVVIGSMGVESEERGDFELGYWLGRAYWGRGYASEAATAMMAFAFGQRRLPYVRSRYINDNPASKRVLIKTGFLATGRSTLFHKVRAREVEITHVILTRDAWAPKQV